MLRHALGAAALLAALPAATAQGATVTAPATEDTSVEQQNPITNFGNVAFQLSISIKAEDGRYLLARFLADLRLLLPGVSEVAPFTSGGNDIADTAVNKHDAK